MSDPYTSIWCTATENSVNVANNTSNVTVSLICSSSGYAYDDPNYWLKVNGTTVRSGTRNFDSGQTFTLCTYTADIAHNTDGTGSITYQGYFQGTAKPDPGNTTQTYTLTLTTINRKSTWNTVNNFNFENSFSFTYTEQVSSFTANVTLATGTFTKTITNYISGANITLTTSEKNQLYALAPNSTSLSFTLTLTTLNGTTEIGTDVVTKTGSFTATNPSYSGTFTYTPSTVILGYSSVEFFLSTTATAYKGASITKYRVTVGSAYKESSSYTGPFLFNTINNSTATLTVYDSRGLTATKTITISTDGSSGVALDVDTATNRVGVGWYITTEDSRSLSVAGDIYEGGSKLSNKYGITYTTADIQAIAQQAMIDLMEASY